MAARRRSQSALPRACQKSLPLVACVFLVKVFWKGEFEGKNLFFKKGFPLLIKLEKTSTIGSQLAGDRKFFQVSETPLSTSALRRKPSKILRMRRAIPTCWIAAVSAAEEEKNASYRSLKKARVSLSHSERVPFCANSAFRIPNSELFRSLLFEPLNQFFIAAFFGAIQNGSFDCVFVVDFEWGLASVVFGVYIRSMLDQIFR